jgi:AcrR family transcriptional regulator
LSNASGVERPRRADAQRNRDSVLRAAGELFADVGLRAGIEDIARRAGVGVGTVCRNFPTKEALVEAVVTANLRTLVDEANDALADPDAGAAFERVVFGIAEFLTRHRALAEEMAADLGLAARADLKRELESTMNQLVQRAQAVGRLRPDIGPADVAMLLSGAAHAAALAGVVDASLRERFVRVILDGLRTPDPSPLPGEALGLGHLDGMKKRTR